MMSIETLTPELQKVAIEELGEVPARVAEDLQALKKWMQQQPHLKPYNNEQYLIQFLRNCKYSLERAKEKLDFWLSYPKTIMLKDIDDPIFRKLLKKGSVMPLPTPLHGCGPRIILVRPNYNANEFTTADFNCYLSAVHSVMQISDPYGCINGCIYIFDYAEFTTNHLLQCDLNFLQKVVAPAAKNSLFRIKGVCALNLPTFAEHLLKMLLSLMSEKIRKRHIICNKNWNDLYELVPQKYLPLEYGGENGSLEQLIPQQIKDFEKHREYINQLYECRSDEQLRLGKSPIKCEEHLGVSGSFRKLDFD